MERYSLTHDLPANRFNFIAALYKRTCEELALLGYMKSGVYEIDIDGNGPHPPAHVRCEFETHSGVRKTVVEHNLPQDAVNISLISVSIGRKIIAINRNFSIGNPRP